VIVSSQPELTIRWKLENHFKMRWNSPNPPWCENEFFDEMAKIGEEEQKELLDELLSIKGIEETI
jgi:hypothetical protein